MSTGNLPDTSAHVQHLKLNPMPCDLETSVPTKHNPLPHLCLSETFYHNWCHGPIFLCISVDKQAIDHATGHARIDAHQHGRFVLWSLSMS